MHLECICSLPWTLLEELTAFLQPTSCWGEARYPFPTLGLCLRITAIWASRVPQRQTIGHTHGFHKQSKLQQRFLFQRNGWKTRLGNVHFLLSKSLMICGQNYRRWCWTQRRPMRRLVRSSVVLVLSVPCRLKRSLCYRCLVVIWSWSILGHWFSQPPGDTWISMSVCQ